MGKRKGSGSLVADLQKKHTRTDEPPSEDTPIESQDAERGGEDADGTPAATDGGVPQETGEKRRPVVGPPPRSAYKIPAYTHENRNMRLYAGPLRKWDRRQALVNTVYGPRADDIKLFLDLQKRWERCTYPTAYGRLITKTKIEPRGEVLVSPWLPNNLESDQQAAYVSWCSKYAATQRAEGRLPFGETEEISVKKASPFLPWNVCTQSDLDIVMDTGRSYCLQAGESSTHILSNSLRETEARPPSTSSTPDGGLFFNPGGKVASLAWAPIPHNRQVEGSLLAVAVVPHDHDDDDDNADNADTGFLATTKQDRARLEERLGSIQFWRVALRGGKTGEPKLFDDGARLDWVCCFYWGWPKRLEWCPVQPLIGDSWPGLLAVLTEDGIVHIIKAQRGAKDQPQYGKIVRPLASLDFPNEDGVHATCMSWVGTNRIVVGYNDGTVALWSLHPQLVLLRIQTHMAPVQDIRTGYPSKPYLVAIRPVEGVLRLIDLTRPSSEHTYHPSPVAGIQANMLDWAEHMQGFATAAPINSPVNNKLDFMHHRHFPCPRKFFPNRRESPPTCLAVGKVHPFTLVGAADGKVWACNMLDTVFPTHWETHIPSSTLIFQSEFRSQPERERYFSSIPAGGSASGGTLFRFLFKQDTDTKADILDDDAMELEDVSGLGASGQEALGPVVHEKSTAVTALAWNPDLVFGTYFAIGLASGLVLIRQLDGTA